MTPETKIANLQISGAKHMWKLLGPGMYNSRPLFPVTVRELLQNSHDAQKSAGVTSPITFTVSREASGAYSLVCDDAGIGMDAQTIHDKFLVLGESGKEEGVGGFGVAKASILGACSSWELRTQTNLLTSEMLGNAPISRVDGRNGCLITLRYDADEGNALKPSQWSIRDAISYIVTSSVAAKVITRDNTGKELVIESSGLVVDEKRLVATIEDECNVLKVYLVPKVKFGPFLSFGYGSSNEHSINGRIIYRLNGLTQFIGWSRNTNAEFNAVVDVVTKARPRDLKYPFTVSREEMIYEYSNAVDEKTESLFVNNLSTEIMLREKCGEKETVTTYYDGDLCSSYGKISSRADERRDVRRQETEERRREKEAVRTAAFNREQEAMNRELSGVMAEFVGNGEMPTPEDVECVAEERHGLSIAAPVREVLQKIIERSPTGIKTCIKITNAHKSIKPLTKRNIKLLQAWTVLVGTIMETNSRYQHPFGIGLVFDPDYCAQRMEEGGIVYYMFNPLKYKVSDTMNTALTMMLDACHEITHTRCKNHDEDFTVSENNLRQDFLKHHGINALYALARFLRVGSKNNES